MLAFRDFSMKINRNRDTRGRTWLPRERLSRIRDGKKGRTAGMGGSRERKGNAALIICTRTSLLSCGGRTRPLQLWHSALPSCFHSLRPPLSSLDTPPTVRLPTPLVLPPRSSSLAHFSARIARARGISPSRAENFNYNRNYHPSPSRKKVSRS